jgi:hypothetical protein
MFENEIPRRIFGPKRGGITKYYRRYGKLRNFILVLTVLKLLISFICILFNTAVSSSDYIA